MFTKVARVSGLAKYQITARSELRGINASTMEQVTTSKRQTESPAPGTSDGTDGKDDKSID